MDKLEFEEIGEVCPHRTDGVAGWVQNDGVVAPILCLKVTGYTICTLLNQRIVLQCPECFEAIRLSGLSKCLHRRATPPRQLPS